MWNNIGKSRKKTVICFLVMVVAACIVFFAVSPSSYAQATGNGNQVTDNRTNEIGRASCRERV